MKALNTIIKILTALAAIAGVVYIIATYGEQIVAWCKKTLASFPKCPCCEEEEPEVEVEITIEPDAEAAEEAVAEEVIAEEVSAEEAVEADFVEETAEPVADEADFAE